MKCYQKSTHMPRFAMHPFLFLGVPYRYGTDTLRQIACWSAITDLNFPMVYLLLKRNQTGKEMSCDWWECSSVLRITSLAWPFTDLAFMDRKFSKEWPVSFLQGIGWVGASESYTGFDKVYRWPIPTEKKENIKRISDTRRLGIH